MHRIDSRLSQHLIDKYPSVFESGDRNRLVAECGPGWGAILETLCFLVNERNLRGTDGVAKIRRVQEKFGAVRILMHQSSPEIEAWINFALQHSMRTCEVCGAVGRLVFSEGWQRTRCDAHKADPIPTVETGPTSD